MALWFEVMGPHLQSFSEMGNLLFWIVLPPEPKEQLFGVGSLSLKSTSP